MRSVVVVIALAACGDNLAAPAPVDDARSGDRLKLEWHLYEDGTRQLEPTAFYDVRLHARCTPAPWADDTLRCVPAAGETAFTDAACTEEVGQARTRNPQFFVRTDVQGGVARPAQLFRAGPRRDAPAALYARRGDACVAIAVEPDATFYDLGGPGDVVELVAVEEGAGDDRLGLALWTAGDGLRAPRGFVDRELGVPCRPQARGDGGAACVPDAVPVARHFVDHQCTAPAVVAGAAPALAAVGAGACATYHAVEPTPVTAAYARRGDACVRVDAAVPAYRLGAAIALPAVERHLEDAGRRLQRIVVTAGALRAYDARLYDTATRTECARHALAYGSRCLPADAAPARRVFANAVCGYEVAIAEVPATCASGAFAVAGGAEPSVHVIGAPHAEPVFARGPDDACGPYAPAADAVAHAAGPALPLDVFVGAIPYGER